MTRTRRVRKVPITDSTSSKSAKAIHTRTHIRKFHVLLKKKSQLASLPVQPKVKAELDEVEKEITSMGGLEAYQAMSAIGQSVGRGGGSEKYLIMWLKELQFRPKDDTKLRCVLMSSLARCLM